MNNKDTVKGDVPKAKDMNFPKHKGKKFVDNLVHLEKINDILEKQHSKVSKGWLER